MKEKEIKLFLQFYDGSVSVYDITDAYITKDSIEFYLKDGESRNVSLDNVKRSHIRWGGLNDG